MTQLVEIYIDNGSYWFKFKIGRKQLKIKVSDEQYWDMYNFLHENGK
jgi:hypothetical protein